MRSKQQLSRWLAAALGLVLGALPTSSRALEPPSRSAGAYQPNQPLVTHEGKSVRFYDDLVKGRVVIMNFMFTTCGSICPPMTQNLVKVQKLIQPLLGKQALMLSISVDPKADTPKALAEYAARYGVGPGWYFLTGKPADVDAVLAKLGNFDPDKDRHSGMLIIGSDPLRTFRKVFAMSDPKDIAKLVEDLVAATSAATTPTATPPSSSTATLPTGAKAGK